MNKKWKTTSLAVVGVALVANPISLQLLGVNSSANDIYYSNDNDLYDKQIQEATDIVKKAKKTWVEEDIKMAIDTLIQLPYANGYKLEEKDKLLDELFYFIDGLSDNDFKARYGTYFIEASLVRLNESLIYEDLELANALVSTLPESKIKTKYLVSLNKIKKLMSQDLLDRLENSGDGKTPPLDWSKLPSDAFEPYEPEDTGNYLPGYPIPDAKPPTPPDYSLPEENYTQDVEYKTIGGKCYKVTTKTAVGKQPVVTKEVVTGYDTAFCSVLVMGSNNGNNNGNSNSDKPYDFNQVSPAPPASGDNINGGKNDNNSYFGNDKNDSSNSDSEDDENKNSLTLQFTLDKTEAEPHFYETDMIVSKDGTITYQQQRDILFQLAIRSGGKAVEDKNRFLVLLENKIIVVEKQGDKIPVNSFDSILKDFKAEVKALERKVGKE